MKKYNEIKVQITKFASTDIITASNETNNDHECSCCNPWKPCNQTDNSSSSENSQWPIDPWYGWH